MSEERIKERCKREDIALKIIKGFFKKDCYTDSELEYSLNTLLDLYNKQKEVNKSIVYNFEKLVDKYEELSDKYFKLLGELNNEK